MSKEADRVIHAGLEDNRGNNLHRELHVQLGGGLRAYAGFGCASNSGSDGSCSNSSTGRCFPMSCPTGPSRTMGGTRRRLAVAAGTAAGNRAAEAAESNRRVES